jgi:hypothetical protein
MSYPPTSDLLNAANAGIRFFEVEDSLGSRTLVRRQLAISSASAIALANLKEGHWVRPDPANVDQYISVPGLLPDNVPVYVVASLTGSQPDVLESGGVTGLAGTYVGRTKMYDTTDATYAPGDLLTVNLVDIGDGAGAVNPGLIKTGATAAKAVARVEFFDSPNGVLKFTILSR